MENTTKESNAKQVIPIVIVALIVIITWVLMSNAPKGPTPTTTPTTDVPTTTASTTPVTEQKPLTTKPVAPKAPSVSYGTLVSQYEGKRIQFNDSCAATSNQMSIKNGTAIMFDNRANKAMTLGLSGRTYSIKALGYMIIKVTSSELPNTVWIDCNGQYKVGKLLVQG